MAKYISLVKYTATVAKIILTVSSGGAVSTETLHAFPEEEYRKIISELP